MIWTEVLDLGWSWVAMGLAAWLVLDLCLVLAAVVLSFGLVWLVWSIERG